MEKDINENDEISFIEHGSRSLRYVKLFLLKFERDSSISVITFRSFYTVNENAGKCILRTKYFAVQKWITLQKM